MNNPLLSDEGSQKVRRGKEQLGDWAETEGSPSPLGVTWIEQEESYNLALYSEHAKSIYRSAYRELIVTTPGFVECIPGAILCDEAIPQLKKDGTPFVKIITDAGIIPGIKIDTGAKDMAGHPRKKITEGLDGLRGRLAEYSQMGALFLSGAR